MMRKMGWIAASLMFVLAGCGDDNTSTPSTDAGPADVGATDTGNGGGDAGPRDTGVRDTGTADAGRSTAGNACSEENACGEGLNCFGDIAGGFCSSSCMPGTAARERAQCGGTGGTCLQVLAANPMGTTAQERMGVAFCLQTCDPAAQSGRSGACRAGYVCTVSWTSNADYQNEEPGCYPYCTEDAHCMGVQNQMGQALNRCNPRTGACQAAAVNTALLADGSPCNPTMSQTTPQCRGVCFRTSSSTTQGICGSFLNIRAANGCHDGMAIQPLAPPGTDNRAICIFKSCESNADCTAPHICRFQEDAMGQPATQGGRFCDYPTTGQPTGVTGDGGTRTDAAVTDAPAPTDAPATTDAPAPADVPATTDAGSADATATDASAGNG